MKVCINLIKFYSDQNQKCILNAIKILSIVLQFIKCDHH